MTKSIMDTSDVIIRRIYIAVIFQRAKCILHYKYLLPARTDTRYDYSRSTCIEAALQLLGYQLTLYQESQSGGRLSNDRWKISSIVNANFFLASTLLSLELDYDISAVERSPNHQRATTSTDRRWQIIDALHNSYIIWIELSDSSREARKVVDVLNFVLGKAQRIEARPPGDVSRNWNGVPHVNNDSTRIARSGMFNLTSYIPCTFTIANVIISLGTSLDATDIQSPVSQYGTNTTAAETPLNPTSIPQLLLLNAGAHIDYSGITIEPSSFVSKAIVQSKINLSFPLTKVCTLYQTQSLDEFLEMTPNFPAMF